MRDLGRLFQLVFWRGNGAAGLRRWLVAGHQLSWGAVNTLVGVSAGVFTLLVLRGRLGERRGLPFVLLPGRVTQAVTLGPVIIATGRPDAELLDHERGHWLQSVALGPLYFLVVGLPSLLHMMWFHHRFPHGPHALYFRFYTEAWADAWGGITRQKNGR